MSLLDRLKPQPRWKSPDPAVRLTAIPEIEDAADLMAVAREDADAAVRRAAVRRLGDVAFLASIAREDADERVRDEAAASLIEIAVGGDAADSEAAAAGLSDARHLAQVARTSAHAAAREAALARLTDAHALGSVARQAGDLQTAMQAFERLTDDHELLDVAVNSEHKDVALAALEKVASQRPEARATFETVAARAKHKSVGRRAAALVQALDDAAAARQAAEAARREAQDAACRTVEGLASAADWREAEKALARAEDEWEQLGADASDDLARRFTAAAEAAREMIARRQREALEEEQRVQALAAARAARVALCERVEGLPAVDPDAPSALEIARAEWSALGVADLLPADAQELTARFDRACAEYDRRRQDAEAAHAALARIDALSVEAEALAAEPDRADAPRRWTALRAEWDQLLASGATISDEMRQRFDRAAERLAVYAAELRKQQEQAKRDNLSRLTQLCVHLEARAGAEDLKLKEVDRGLRNIRTALENLPPLPSRKDEETLVERLKALQAALVPRARELREMDEWKRFANAAAQEQLIAQMEALRAETDLEKAALALRDLHTRWREVAEAPRDQAESLWHRFKTASDDVRAVCSEFFAQRAEERNHNLQAKLSLCERAEALADSTDWIKTAETFKQLQAEWKTIGPVSRKHAKVVWKRFRGACDQFFTRRHDDLVQRKQAWAANLEHKLALCAQAEALAERTDWETAAAEIRRLQAEWKTVGPVRKNKSELVWLRFRAACDRFFERYKHRHQLDLSARLAEREAAVVEIEALVPTDTAAPPENLGEQLLASWSGWNHLPPIPRELIEPLVTRLTTAVDRIVSAHPDRFKGSMLDPEANRRKMEALCQRVEACLSAEPDVAPAPAGTTPATILAQRLREALAANTIAGRNNRVSDDARWRAGADDVKDAQAAWRRLGPVPGDAGRALTDRFNRACQRFFDQQRRRRAAGQQGPGAPGRPR